MRLDSNARSASVSTGRAIPRHNQRSNTLSPLLIRHAKHKRFFNGLKHAQCRFNLRWIHILAASHNQVAAALHEEEVAILIEIAEVAGE